MPSHFAANKVVAIVGSFALAALPLAAPGLAALSVAVQASSPDSAAKIDAYVRPYADGNNFSGMVLVERGGNTIFQHAYGFADRERKEPNAAGTRFHIASMSMQFTAAAILRLVDRGELQLDEPIATYAPQITGGDKVTIRDLLTERSGIPDINQLPEYNDILQQHQTPESLVAKISGRPLVFEPGTKFLHEEHSAYNLLALIVEKKTGLPFAAAMNKLVFEPAGLTHSAIDDDTNAVPDAARGYQPVGLEGITAAPAIHWSAKSGNASVCTSAGDEAKWVAAVMRGPLLSEPSRNAMLDRRLDTGFGWFNGENSHLGETAYYMNGRAPGFSSFVVYLPREDLTVVVLSNIYSSSTTTIGYDVARIALGRAMEPLRLGGALSAAALKSYTGTFQFGSDFYQKNARMELKPAEGYVSLVWPGGSVSALIPLEKDRFMDRSYWESVSIERDAAGTPAVLRYGEYKGTSVRKP
jgi:CubicO group peptidase (beta-lactamase class C family)